MSTTNKTDLAAFQANEVANLPNKKLLRWMFGFLKPVKLLCAIACLYLTLTITGEVLATAQTGNAINRLKDFHDGQSLNLNFWNWFTGGEHEKFHLSNLLQILWPGSGTQTHHASMRDIMILLSVLTVLVLVLRYMREVINTRLSMTIVYHIRSAVYDKLQHVGFGFHDSISTGQLINRALTDLQNVRVFVQTAILVTLEIILVVGGYMILLASRSQWVAWLSLVPLPIWMLYIMQFGKKVQPASKAVMEAEDKNVNIITENIAGVHVVKAFATEKHEIARYNKHCDNYFQQVIARIRLYAGFMPIVRGIASASHLSLFFVVGILVIKGKLEPGDFLILGTAMGSILGRLQQVAVISEQYQNAIVSSRRLYEVLHAPMTVPEKSDAIELNPRIGVIRFENVTFGYDPAKPVLHDVSFEIKGGSVAAIVGPTGAGKTTLVNLLARFYDPTSGRITIDGIDLRDLALSSLRKKIAFVFQETYLFSDTVASNISYGKPAPKNSTDMSSISAVEAASRLAQAHEFIETLPRGYESMLGERGATLSGGQRQRLAIARAILAAPSILVLDDATAAVDPETEDLIRKGMNKVLHERTTLMIAHRISSVKRADLVIVIEHGRVSQIGNHEKLMSEEGHYRDIAAAQLYGDDVTRGQDDPSHMRRVQDDRRVSATADAARDKQRMEG